MDSLLTGLIPTQWKWYHSSHRSQQIMFVSSADLQIQYNCLTPASAGGPVGAVELPVLPALSKQAGSTIGSLDAYILESSGAYCFLRSFLEAVPFPVVARELIGPMP